MATPGDALGDSKTMGSSPADQYYRWKLMSDKYAVAADERLSDTAKSVLGATSEKEAIKFKILAKLVAHGESSAFHAQCKEYTGSDDKLEQAEKLAELIHDNMKTKKILAVIAGTDGDFDAAFTENGRRPGGGAGLSGSLIAGFSGLIGALGGGGGGGGAAAPRVPGG